MSKVLNIDDSNLDMHISNNEYLVLDFWADWCGPCKMMSPIIDVVSEVVSGVQIAKIDVNYNPISASRFGVTSIPTILFLKGGNEVNRVVGVMSKARLEGLIADMLGG